MRIDVNWDDHEKTILIWTFDGLWTWGDFWSAKTISDEMIDEVNHVVDIIGDVTNSQVLPKDAFMQYKQAEKSNPKNLGVIVLVGCSPLVKTMVEGYSKILHQKRRFFFADSAKQARTLLQTRKVSEPIQ